MLDRPRSRAPPAHVRGSRSGARHVHQSQVVTLVGKLPGNDAAQASGRTGHHGHPPLLVHDEAVYQDVANGTNANGWARTGRRHSGGVEEANAGAVSAPG